MTRQYHFSSIFSEYMVLLFLSFFELLTRETSKWIPFFSRHTHSTHSVKKPAEIRPQNRIRWEKIQLSHTFFSSLDRQHRFHDKFRVFSFVKDGEVKKKILLINLVCIVLIRKECAQTSLFLHLPFFSRLKSVKILLIFVIFLFRSIFLFSLPLL